MEQTETDLKKPSFSELECGKISCRTSSEKFNKKVKSGKKLNETEI